MPRWSLPALMLVAACGKPADDPTMVTPEQDRQLNQAAATLDDGSFDANTFSNESQP